MNSNSALSSFTKKLFLTVLILIKGFSTQAQQFGLYNSRTLFDVFENPSQSAYQIDTSKRVAFNFLIPTLTLNGAFSGPAESAFKSLLYDAKFEGDNLPVGTNEYNTLTLNTNTYMGMLRILLNVKHSAELGISWQVRNDGRIKVSNETIAIFDDYKLFSKDNYEGLFNNKGYNQSFHQFSVTYRKNYNKRMAVGFKASLLSGITYNSLDLYQSDLSINSINDAITVNVGGRFRSSYDINKEFNKKSIYPFLKNPGLAFSAGGSYKFPYGWFVMANLKDIGFIRWNKRSFEYQINTGDILIENASDNTADNRLADMLEEKIGESASNRSMTSALNGKAEVLLNKDFGNYQPNLILSKSLFYKGGDIALTNNYHLKNKILTLTGSYNTEGFMAIGGQFMIKSPNAEFFIGSDQVFKTLETVRNFYNGSYPYSGGHTAASFYMGFGLKFGRVMEHPANSSSIPGFERDPEGGFFRKLLKKKEN